MDDISDSPPKRPKSVPVARKVSETDESTYDYGINPIRNAKLEPHSSSSKSSSQYLNHNPEGLSVRRQKLSPTHEQILERYLEDGEIVLFREFNCYFPNLMIPVWQMILWTVITFGLYLYVLAYHAILRWCYRMRICTPRKS